MRRSIRFRLLSRRQLLQHDVDAGGAAFALVGQDLSGFADGAIFQAGRAAWRCSIIFQIIGVRISCMASGILPPGMTMVLGRDMKA